MKEKLVHLEQRFSLKTVALGTFIASVPFSRPLSIFLLCIFVFFWIIGSSAKEKYQIILNRPAVLLPCLLFLIYSFSLLYSSYKDFFFLEKRLLLLCLPFIIGSIKLDKQQITKILNFFITGCFLFTLWSFVEAYQFYNLPTQHFSWQHLPHQLAITFHAPYLSLFLVLSNFFILFQAQEHNKILGWQYFILVYFSLFILILSSRTALVSNISLLLYYFYLHLASRKRLKLFWLGILALCLIFALTYQFYPHFQERVSATSKVGNGILERFVSFKASIKIISTNPFLGVGIGDLQNEMNLTYEQLGLSRHFFRLNSQNEYLFTAAATGLPGLFTLLAIMIYPVFMALKHRHYFIVAFYLVFSLAFMTEVVLARFWGVASFSFFYSIFTSYLLDLVSENKDKQKPQKAIIA